MSNVIIPINHKLGQAEALKRIKKYTREVVEILPVQLSNLHVAWNGPVGEFSLIYAKMRFQGALTINDNVISIKGKIPIILLPMKKQIEKIIRHHAAIILK
jgi:hypothetical protein